MALMENPLQNFWEIRQENLSKGGNITQITRTSIKIQP